MFLPIRKEYDLLFSLFSSPSFHNKRYLIDSTSIEKSFSVGSQISFSMTGSIPDEELLTDMKNESILHPNVVRKHVRRLLDSKPDRFSRLFISQWLGFSTVMDMMGEEKYKG